ncbi:hypothetical protein ACOSP7_017217 [Xanthoceras sorbifolium]
MYTNHHLHLHHLPPHPYVNKSPPPPTPSAPPPYIYKSPPPPSLSPPPSYIYKSPLSPSPSHSPPYIYKSPPPHSPSPPYPVENKTLKQLLFKLKINITRKLSLKNSLTLLLLFHSLRSFASS